LFFDGVVIAGLWTKNGGLNRALIADTMETAEHAEHLDQSMLRVLPALATAWG
jgi:hypothetical protein